MSNSSDYFGVTLKLNRRLYEDFKYLMRIRRQSGASLVTELVERCLAENRELIEKQRAFDKENGLA